MQLWCNAFGLVKPPRCQCAHFKLLHYRFIGRAKTKLTFRIETCPVFSIQQLFRIEYIWTMWNLVHQWWIIISTPILIEGNFLKMLNFAESQNLKLGPGRPLNLHILLYDHKTIADILSIYPPRLFPRWQNAATLKKGTNPKLTQHYRANILNMLQTNTFWGQIEICT